VSTSVLWFRRDLRLRDNPALLAAAGGTGEPRQVLPLFVLDPALWEPAGPARRAYLLTSLGSMFYFGKRKLWTWQLILPAIAIILLGYLFKCNVVPVPAAPYNLLPYIVIAWVVLGVIVSFICGGASGKTVAGSGSSFRG